MPKNRLAAVVAITLILASGVALGDSVRELRCSPDRIKVFHIDHGAEDWGPCNTDDYHFCEDSVFPLDELQVRGSTYFSHKDHGACSTTVSIDRANGRFESAFECPGVSSYQTRGSCEVVETSVKF